MEWVDWLVVALSVGGGVIVGAVLVSLYLADKSEGEHD